MTAPTTSATQTVAALGEGVTPTRPSFLGMVRSELQKTGWRRAIWFSLLGIGLLMLLLNGITYFFVINALTNPPTSGAPGQPPAPVIPATAIPYMMMTLLLSNVREYSGLVVAILTVLLISVEYQLGTIRIVLARGVGRIRLLVSKFVALLIAGLIALLVILGLNVLELIVAAAAQGQSDALLGHIPSYLWSDAGAYLLTILYNLVVTMLLAAFITVLSRSLAFGLVGALAYWFAEGIVSTILQGVAGATQNKAWSDVTHYFLGTNLSNLASTVLPRRDLPDLSAAFGGGGAGGAPFDATHAIVVTLIYSAIFLGVSLYLTWKRDVLQ
jgi:ABC-type transport system involved in multi-copper enzyme maturation permease subunit